jgi:hypothetical protein
MESISEESPISVVILRYLGNYPGEVGYIIPNQIPETSSLSLIHCSGRFFITMKAQIKIGRLEIVMRTSITDRLEIGMRTSITVPDVQ